MRITNQPINIKDWSTYRKILAVGSVMTAATIPFLPDGLPGSPRSIATAVSLACAAGAAAI